MSYKPLSSSHRENDEHDDGAAPIAVPPARPASRFFRSSDAVHTGISVAAGVVMTLFGYEQGVFGGVGN